MQDEIDFDDERHALIREARQRLELLRRSGVAYRLRGEAALSVVPPVHQPDPPGFRTIHPEILLTTHETEPEDDHEELRSSAHQVPVAVIAPPDPIRTEVVPAPPPLHSEPMLSKSARLTTPKERAPVPIATGSLFGEPTFDLPVIDAAERPDLLAAEASIVAGCTKCKLLAETRTQTVFGVGSPTARLMFIGEAPGADEDRTGIPFVGKAGQLLTEMITKGMGIAREDVYIANILKCRPPENRQPTNAESANCIGYLERQIAIIRPEFLCLLGRTAAQGILETTVSMSHLRGKWHRYRDIATLVTYHPSYLLRNPPSKKEAWEDLQMLMKAMGLAIPRRK